MASTIFRNELYCRLSTLKAHYLKLLSRDFPTEGCHSLAKLVNRIVERIVDRYDFYTESQLKLISGICNSFEEWCGDLFESQMHQPPWGVLPVLENTFASLKKDVQFAICPRAESNYSILNWNILDALREKVVNVPNLLFDCQSLSTFSEQVVCFLHDMPKGLIFIFFPRFERASALHFALLGHELGHIYAEEWAKAHFNNFIIKHDINQKFLDIAKQEFKANQISHSIPLMENIYAEGKKDFLVGVSKRILQESIADIFGAMLYGEAALTATFVYAGRSTLDSQDSWSRGYLSWRYRLGLIKQAIDIAQNRYKWHGDKTDLLKEIETTLQTSPKDPTINEYLKTLVTAMDADRNDFFDEVLSLVGGECFAQVVKNNLVAYAEERIGKGIPPNAYLDSNLKETPLDYRNILCGAWRCVSKHMVELPVKYMEENELVDRLTIKGIELACEQRYFNDANQK